MKIGFNSITVQRCRYKVYTGYSNNVTWHTRKLQIDSEISSPYSKPLFKDQKLVITNTDRSNKSYNSVLVSLCCLSFF